MRDFAGKKILIAGRGISGEGAYEALIASGAECAFSDDAEIPNFDPNLIVVSPGISVDRPIFGYAEGHNVPIIGEIELGYLLNDAPIVAVTGTNGKTTVTRLIGRMLAEAGLRAAVCGNIGQSFAAVAKKGGYDYAVVECSSFQLETVSELRPRVAVITNISPDHLDRHKTMKAYCDAKLNIALHQQSADILILSQDDIPLYALEGFVPKGNTMYTSVRGRVYGTYVVGDKIYFMGEEICRTDRIKTEGEHNIKNALSAICAAKVLGVQDSAIVSALTKFDLDAHRLHLVARIGGKNYYDDSKGTNIMASVRAAECMVGDTCMIVGGSDKGYEYDLLFRLLPPVVVRVAAVGATARKVYDAAHRCGFSEIKTFGDFTEAFNWAADGDEENVLLSPASASFDMFGSYAERGEFFERLVKNVKR